MALVNLRLGAWLPNPLSPNRRRLIDAGPQRTRWWSATDRKNGGLGPGFEALVGVFFGLHGEGARHIFVTDGGHYDNLGLLALLRARCDTIWCVKRCLQQAPTPRPELERVVGLAMTELDVAISIDIDRFALVSGSTTVVAHAAAQGTIETRERRGRDGSSSSSSASARPHPPQWWRTGSGIRSSPGWHGCAR